MEDIKTDDEIEAENALFIENEDSDFLLAYMNFRTIKKRRFK